MVVAWIGDFKILVFLDIILGSICWSVIIKNLLFKSYSLYSKTDKDTYYLIITNKEFENKIKDLLNKHNINGGVWIINISSRLKKNSYLYNLWLYK